MYKGIWAYDDDFHESWRHVSSVGTTCWTTHTVLGTRLAVLILKQYEPRKLKRGNLPLTPFCYYTEEVIVHVVVLFLCSTNNFLLPDTFFHVILHTLVRLCKPGPCGRAQEWARLGVDPLSWLLSDKRLGEVPGNLTKCISLNRLLLSNQDKRIYPSSSSFSCSSTWPWFAQCL